MADPSRKIPWKTFRPFPALPNCDPRCKFTANLSNMKMLFYSSDDAEVRLVSKRFMDAGIACEIRQGPFPASDNSHASDTELWIRNDKDCHRAFMLCVALGLGFARRKEKAMAA